MLEINCNLDDERALEEPAPAFTAPAETPAPSTSTTEDDRVPAKWLSVASHKCISAAIGSAPSITCNHCEYKCTSRKLLLLPARVHRVHCLCKCSYALKWSETGRKHRVDPRNTCDPEGHIYEVDQVSFEKWKRILGVTISTYPGSSVG